MPASDLSDGYSEYIMMNQDLKTKTRDELYEEAVWLRAMIRSHRDYKKNQTDPDTELYKTCLPEERVVKS